MTVAHSLQLCGISFMKALERFFKFNIPTFRSGGLLLITSTSLPRALGQPLSDFFNPLSGSWVQKQALLLQVWLQRTQKPTIWFSAHLLGLVMPQLCSFQIEPVQQSHLWSIQHLSKKKSLKLTCIFNFLLYGNFNLERNSLFGHRWAKRSLFFTGRSWNDCRRRALDSQLV